MQEKIQRSIKEQNKNSLIKILILASFLLLFASALLLFFNSSLSIEIEMLKSENKELKSKEVELEKQLEKSYEEGRTAQKGY